MSNEILQLLNITRSGHKRDAETAPFVRLYMVKDKFSAEQFTAAENILRRHTSGLVNIVEDKTLSDFKPTCRHGEKIFQPRIVIVSSDTAKHVHRCIFFFADLINAGSVIRGTVAACSRKINCQN